MSTIIRIECTVELLQELLEAQAALERSRAKKRDAPKPAELHRLIVKVAGAAPLLPLAPLTQSKS